jgi:hypothetical protein
MVVQALVAAVERQPGWRTAGPFSAEALGHGAERLAWC